MQLWKLQIPSIIPEESKPFLEDRFLGREGIPFFCLKRGVPLRHHWLDVMQDAQNDRPGHPLEWYTWQQDRVNHYYPSIATIQDAFAPHDTASFSFNVSDYPGAQVFGCIERIRYSNLC